MSVFDSECSSGCESGWTAYLEQSFLNKNASTHHGDKRVYSVGEEEDLSMVSDASSGPPHLLHDDAYFNEDEDNGCFYSASKAVKPTKSGTKKQKKVKENKYPKDHQKHLPSFLHDTASSQVFDFSTNNVGNGTNRKTYRGSMLDYSQGFSANNSENFEGRASFQEEHFAFLQQSCLSENEFQGNK